ncbi:periplasmic heavy metal sensor [Oleisolibacter albus]|uniref:periplasmic heavy metal sensor n=1 Tax=Oleisolibacter albus TaxID=2171757 RepID=UPI000DF20E63|nr:periplasmic heavy metal sensor [Oleisolibacter albus]
MRRQTLILTILLVLSVSANLAVAGIVLGHRLHGGPFGKEGHRPPYPELAMGHVPSELRKALWSHIRNPEDPAVARGEALRDTVRQAMAEAARTLRARPFDADAATAALARLRQTTQYAQERVHGAIVQTLDEAQSKGTLPPPPDPGDEPPGRRDGGPEAPGRGER